MGGSDQTIKRRRPHHAPEPPQPAIAPAVGKNTGVAIVDNPMLCERPQIAESAELGDQCFLSETERTRLLVALTTAVGAAMGNFHAAIGNLRTELLTTVKSSGTAWNFFTEFLFQSLSGGLIGMLTKSLGNLKTRIADAEGATISVAGLNVSFAMQQKIAAVDVKHITGAAVQASKGVRTVLKNAAHGPSVASAENVEAADFLKLVQDGIAPLTNNLCSEQPAAMTDGEIAALVAAYQDMTYHSVAAYEADLRSLIEAFHAGELASIGDGLSTGTDRMTTREAVFVVAEGRTRMAIVEYYNPIYGKTQPIKGVDGKPVPWDQPVFISWIDDRLGGFAMDYQTERVGPQKLVDATGGKTGMPEIDRWAVSP